MDKKTLIRLAQPAATFLLALSIFSIPLTSKANFNGLGTSDNPLYVKCLGMWGGWKCK